MSIFNSPFGPRDIWENAAYPKAEIFQVFCAGKTESADRAAWFSYRLCVVVGVNRYVLFAQVAAIAEVGGFSCAKVDGDGVVGLGDGFARLFCVKFCRLAVLEYGNVGDSAAHLLRIEFYTARADGR